MIVYADILLAVNWWIDYLLLLGVRHVLGLGVRAWRLVFGGLFGSLFSLVLLLPPLPALVSLLIKLAAAALMVIIAFGWQSRRRYIRALLLLFGLSAGLSGLCSALYHFAAPRDLSVANGVVYYAVSPWLLLTLTVVCYVLMWVFERVMRRRAPARHDFVVRVHSGGRSVAVKCLYDSGNHLTEPFSNRPVLVLERAAVEGLLTIPEDVEDLPPNGVWRVVPYNTLSGGGLLPAFLPDSIVVLTEYGERVIDDCYVAVCPRLGRGEYEGLIGSSLGDRLFDGRILG